MCTPKNTNTAMSSNIELTSNPARPNSKARPLPMPAAIRVAGTYGMLIASNARNTRPPSRGTPARG
jgi:hypothetical protein